MPDENSSNNGSSPAKSSDAGCICVSSQPSDADIFLDCKDTHKKTPACVPAAEGSHSIVVSKDCVTSVSRTVTVKAGSTTTVCLTLMTDENKNWIRVIAAWTSVILVSLVLLPVLVRLGLFKPDDLTRTIVYCACAGGIGGITFSVYALVRHLGIGDFDMAYFWWYMFRPFIGIIYGTMVFFLVAGGLMTLSGTSQDVSSSLFTTKTVMFYLALSFVAGYAENSVSLQLKALAEALFKKPSSDDKSGTQTKSED